MMALAFLLALATPQEAAPAPITVAAPTSQAQSESARLDVLLREYDAWYFHEFPEEARDRGLDIGHDRVHEIGRVRKTSGFGMGRQG